MKLPPHESPLGDEILVIAFTFWPDDVVKATDSQIIRALHDMGGRPEFHGLMKNYGFSSDGLEPDSPVLRQGLDALAHAGLIARDEDFTQIFLKRDILRRRYDLFMAERMEDLAQAMPLFAAALAREIANPRDRF